MKQVKIKRFDKGPDATLGVLLVDDQFCCMTLERPWVYNRIDVSCIPAGDYECEYVISSKHSSGFAYAIKDVPGRTLIRIHIGNRVSDTLGCVLLGQTILPNRTLKNSTKAYDLFMEVLKGDSFKLRIE